jgi:hypothetical protein
VDWLDYAFVVAIVVVISGGGIAVGLFLNRRLARSGERRGPRTAATGRPS